MAQNIITEAYAERIIDIRVQRRIGTDHAYRNANNAEEQSAREDDIEYEEQTEVYRLYRVVS